MSENECLDIINKIFKGIFNQDNKYSLIQILENYAFDIKLPKRVYDSITNEETWADSIGNGKFITNKNMEIKDKNGSWMLEKKNLNSLEEILKIWDRINMRTTERVYDSINVSQSDTIYGCVNVFRSTSSSDCKNIVFCDSCGNSSYLLASKRSYSCNYCIRCDDSKNCSNSYSVVCSNKIRSSIFIEDSFDLEDCMFCCHISSKKYCICNMQFEKEEYFYIKNNIISWIISS